MLIKVGDEILVGNGRKLRVLNVVTFDEESALPAAPSEACLTATPGNFS